MTPRQQGRRGRAAVADRDRDRLAEAVAQRVFRLRPLQRASRVAVYFAVRDELSCAAITQKLAERGRDIRLPILAPKPSGRLLFARWTDDDSLAVNQFGIPEPVRGPGVSPNEIDVAIVPVVAFDGQANRIGTGGGWYDRTFAGRARCAHWTRPYLIGIAFDEQQADGIDPQPHDVAMDWIVTPTRIISRLSTETRT